MPGEIHILVAEDDPNIREGLIDTLTSEGYGVIATANGLEALELYQTHSPALVMLDVMMPEKSGYDVCRAIRKKDSDTPIIMLTAKGEEIDKVVGLELGADDYVTKPFGIHELLARVAAVLRRAGRKTEGRRQGTEDRFLFGGVEISKKGFTAQSGASSVKLTAREIKLIDCFASHPNEVLSRDDLLNAAWGIDYSGTTRTLDQHIAQLRKKIESDPTHPNTVVTVHGVGYRYTPHE